MFDVSGAVKDVIRAYAELSPDEGRCELLDLQGKIYGLVQENLRLASENDELRRENDGLRRELSERKRLEFRDGRYYFDDDSGQTVGPICPSCYRERGFVSVLKKTDMPYRFFCLSCKTSYNLLPDGPA